MNPVFNLTLVAMMTKTDVFLQATRTDGDLTEPGILFHVSGFHKKGDLSGFECGFTL